jgi:hypothetical protein
VDELMKMYEEWAKKNKPEKKWFQKTINSYT